MSTSYPDMCRLTLALVLCLICALPAQAQMQMEQAEAQRKANYRQLFELKQSSAFPPDRRVILRLKNRSVLGIPEDVFLVDLSASKAAEISSGAVSAKLVNLAEKATRFSGQVLTDINAGSASKLLGSTSSDLIEVLAAYKVPFVERLFAPPFDTVYVRKDGEIVQVPDFSLRYVIVLPEGGDRDAFMEALRRVEGVASVSPVVEVKVNDNENIYFPPEDVHYDQQWHLKPGLGCPRSLYQGLC